jgi:hypothetical protein
MPEHISAVNPRRPTVVEKLEHGPTNAVRLLALRNFGGDKHSVAKLYLLLRNMPLKKGINAVLLSPGHDDGDRLG